MIEVTFDDILHQDVDAIVSPTNRYMFHGGGLAAVIAAVAGEDLVKESSQKAPIATGEAILTTAGQLPFKAVIHTVGPVWGLTEEMSHLNNSEENPDLLLAKAHVSAIKLASEAGLTSLAFPAVSCGVFHFPVRRAAPIAIATTAVALKSWPLERVVFCVLDDTHFDAFQQALDGLAEHAEPTREESQES